MNNQTINCDNWISKSSIFGHAAIAGRFIFVDGVFSMKKDMMELNNNDISDETIQIMYKINRILRTCGAQLKDVVMITAYLKDIKTLDQISLAYRSLISWDPPAITAIGIKKLTKDASLMMDCVAYKP